ncbi:imidazole glycerol phosphate synthase subunit HisH [Paenibacillus sp. TRM 82003]|nr:imidazole glycerol phosphate synthase subunit HisH [Paenibacillus sp. TRM 82003]
MIAVIDYGMGNVNSIVNMFKKIGVASMLASSVDQIQRADKLVLPGVGSFDAGMRKLQQSGLVDAIKKHALLDNKPLMGICLGMQMLGKRSEEGTEDGLSLIPFENKRFSFGDRKDLKIPHMGWDFVKISKNDPVVTNFDSEQRYYFVHSYHAVCELEENVLMRCDYGYSFAAAVNHCNIYGFQFHPEKSHKFGMALLDNFARRV